MGGSTGTYSYTINNSLRIRGSANAGLSKTPATSTNSRTWTWSGWVKRGTLGTFQTVWDAYYGNNSRYTILAFNSNDSLGFQSGLYNTGATTNSFVMNTTQLFRDTSAWYHIVIAFDTTQATSTNRIKLYVNGSQVTAFTQYISYNIYPNQNDTTFVNTNTQPMYIGYDAGQGGVSDFYLAEVNFIDGIQLDASYFGATNSTTGTWAPKAYSGSYGTNGFYLPFSDTSGLTSGSNTGIGKDFSGNGNYFNSSNISLTAGSTYDAMLDSPTPKSTTVGNYAVLNPIDTYSASPTFSNGNLTISTPTSGNGTARSTISVSSGKWYWESSVVSWSASDSDPMNGILSPTSTLTSMYTSSTGYAYESYYGQKWHNGVNESYGATYGIGDIIGVALDLDNGTLTFYKNNVSQGVAYTGISGTYCAAISDSSSSGSSVMNINFGQRPFAYTPPTGYKALQTYNLPTPAIKKGNQHFDATLWTGNGTSQTITNSGGFAPDFVWAKLRSGIDNNRLADTIRGANKLLSSNLTDAENSALTTVITGFTSSGFTIGSDGSVNTNSSTYVGWQWKGGGTAVTNTNGSITSQVSANPTAGFSVVTYTGNGAVSTVGHGLGVAPNMVIYKKRNNTASWGVYHSSLGAGGVVFLDLTLAFTASTGYFNNTSPNTTVLTVGAGTSFCNDSGATYVAYCFAAIPGYSAFGSYTGNGSTNGPFVFTGFLPKFVLIKDTTNVNDWFVMDTVRGTYNTILQYLSPNKTTAEGSDLGGFDILSNGFKVRQAGALNNNNATLIYAAFAQNPFQYSLAR